MSVTAKDFIAEATDIAEYLTPHISSLQLANYVQQRCATLFAANALFDRDKFTNMAYGLTDGPASQYYEIREMGLTRLDALEQLAVLRSVLDSHRTLPSRVSVNRDPNADDDVAYGYFVQWKGSEFLATSMQDSWQAIRTVRHG